MSLHVEIVHIFRGGKTRVTFKLKMAMGHSTIGKKSLKSGRFFGRF